MATDSRRYLCLFLLLFCSFVISSNAYQFKVGGRDGWVVNPSENFNQWSGRMRFQVNDTLLFRYKKGSDSVLVVNKDGYDKCNTANPILKLDDGNSVFKFDRSGPFYFISGKKKNCDQGQKLIVVVLAVRNSPTTPPNVPSPGAHPPGGAPSPSGSGSPPSPSPAGGAPTPSGSGSPLSPSPAGGAPAPGISPSSPPAGGAPAPGISPSSPSPAGGAPSPGTGGSGPSPAATSPETSSSPSSPTTPGPGGPPGSPNASTPGSGTPADVNSPPGGSPQGSLAPPSCSTPSIILVTVTLVLSVCLGSFIVSP